MGFKTKLDYSNNRQIKQHLETLTTLSGGTSFGLPFANLTKGPNLATSGETEEYTLVASTFSGNNTTTIYNWYDPRMSIGEPYLSALTPSNSAETQTVLPVFAPSASITIDGNVVNTAFTGVTFDLYNIAMLDLGGGNYSGTVESEFFNVLSADTAEYTGRTIWVDSSGITRTERLIVKNNPTVGYVLTCEDTEGMASWAPSSGSGTGTTSFWSAGTGTDAITTLNSGNIASGNYSLAEGAGAVASGIASHAQNINTQAIGVGSNAEGGYTISFGDYSHAEGQQTKSSGDSSHAEGFSTEAHGPSSHAEGFQTKAIGTASHSEGTLTIASGYASHAGGGDTQANGFASFVHGSGSTANGNYSVVLGRNITGTTDDTTYVDRLSIKTLPIGTPINNLGYDATGRVVVGIIGSGGTASVWSAGTGSNSVSTIGGDNIASGNYSVAQGNETTASGIYAHSEGYRTIASGINSHAQGNTTIASGSSSFATGWLTSANGALTFAGGFRTEANGINSFVYGNTSQANADGTIVLGRFITGDTTDTTYVNKLNIKQLYTGTSVTNLGINAQGFIIAGTSGNPNVWSAGTGSNSVSTVGGNNIASGNFSVAEGNQTTASGVDSHSEGVFSIASGTASHAEGRGTFAMGQYSHSQGWITTASGTGSHAGGTIATALGEFSFVHGSASTAVGDYSVVLGRNITGNTADTTYVDQLNVKRIGSSPSVNDVRIDATGNLTTNTSDKRFKENISPIENALTKINALQGVKFQWKDRTAGGDEFKIGFIAQEVEVVEPLLVFTNKNDGYKGIHIDGIIPLLVEAVKELSNGVTEYSNTYLETQTIQAEDNNIELNYNGTLDSSVDGGITILRGEEKPTSLLIDTDGNWVSNVNILSKGFVIPEYTPINSQDENGVVGNIVQDDDYIYIKRNSGWKRTPKLEDF